MARLCALDGVQPQPARHGRAMTIHPSPQAAVILSLIGLLPPELRSAALLTHLAQEVHRRASRPQNYYIGSCGHPVAATGMLYRDGPCACDARPRP